MQLDTNTTEILIAIITLFAGITITITVKRKIKKNRVTQKGNIVGGDMAGRDINKIQK